MCDEYYQAFSETKIVQDNKGRLPVLMRIGFDRVKIVASTGHYSVDFKHLLEDLFGSFTPIIGVEDETMKKYPQVLDVEVVVDK